MQSKDAFASSRALILKQGNLAVKPSLCPRSGPFVLDGQSELRPLTPAFHTEVETPILPLHFNPINLYLPWLIVELIPFHEALSGRNTPKPANAHTYFDNYTMIIKHGVWGHPQTSGHSRGPKEKASRAQTLVRDVTSLTTQAYVALSCRLCSLFRSPTLMTLTTGTTSNSTANIPRST
jgi:hypothetical protein